MTEATDIIEARVKELEPRIKAKLEEVRKVIIESGRECNTVEDMTSDDYGWWNFSTMVDGGVQEGSIDFSIRVACAFEYGDEPDTGINFSLDVVEYGGRILGGLTPYNYTDAVWVDARDKEAVEERWSIIEGADSSEVLGLIEEATVSEG